MLYRASIFTHADCLRDKKSPQTFTWNNDTVSVCFTSVKNRRCELSVIGWPRATIAHKPRSPRTPFISNCHGCQCKSVELTTRDNGYCCDCSGRNWKHIFWMTNIIPRLFPAIVARSRPTVYVLTLLRTFYMYPEVNMFNFWIHVERSRFSTTDTGILRRIGIASSAMHSMQRVWRQRILSLSTKLRLYQTCVLPILLVDNLSIHHWPRHWLYHWHALYDH